MASPLRSLIDRFIGLRVFVVGDAMIDRYSFGRIERLSPEAPVPIFLEDRRENRVGGAANVAANLEALGCQVAVHFPPVRCLKHRFFVGHHQVFRIDEDRIATPNPTDVLSVQEHLEEKRAQALVVSDYAKGWISERMARSVIAAANRLAIPIIVDPKGPYWSKYQDATVICPNATEFREAHANEHRSAVSILRKEGAKGATLMTYDHDCSTWNLVPVPARARHVYDVTGAGDTVVAVVAAVLAAGGDLYQAAELAMLAAGHVVGELGTVTCPAAILKNLLPTTPEDAHEEPQEAPPAQT